MPSLPGNGRHRSPRDRRRRHKRGGQQHPAAPAAARPEPRKTTCTADVGRWPIDRTDQARAIQSLLRDLGLFAAPPKGRSVRRHARRSASSSSPLARAKPVSPARRCSSNSRRSAFQLRPETTVSRKGRRQKLSAARAGVVSAPRRWPLPPPRNNSHIAKAIPDHTRAIGAGVTPKAVFDAANIRRHFPLLGTAIQRAVAPHGKAPHLQPEPAAQ